MPAAPPTFLPLVKGGLLLTYPLTMMHCTQARRKVTAKLLELRHCTGCAFPYLTPTVKGKAWH